MKGLQVLVLIALLAVSTWGLSGEGPVWSKYVGAAMVLILLMLILQGISNIPTASEMTKVVKATEEPKPVIDADDDGVHEARTRARN